MPETLYIVLAAGEGTRMRSLLPKVMHSVAGRPMLGHVLQSAQDAMPNSEGAVVIGPGADAVATYVKEHAPEAEVFEQTDRKGTAHAVLQAREQIAKSNWDAVVILYGDTPLITPETLTTLIASINEGAVVAVLGFRPENPHGYGRLITDGERLLAIREEKDASDTERKIDLCNSGVVALCGETALSILDRIGNDNAKGEYYLTDAVEIAVSDGHRAVAVDADADEVLGVNTRVELAQAEQIAQWRYRNAAMISGVSLIAPETVWFSYDTEIEPDVVVEPNVVFGPGAKVERGATIYGFSHITGATVRANASIGPYARLRPGAEIGTGGKVGNFVEVKNAVFGPGAKANHLSYIGDARVGARANVGAGVITCNYDGAQKHFTDIGEGAFIGSNSALVAPVKIGDRAYVGTGSIITDDVSSESLALGRARQVEKTGWVRKDKS